MERKQREAEAFKILKEGVKARMKMAVDKEETCMIKDYLDALYNLIQMENNVFFIKKK